MSCCGDKSASADIQLYDLIQDLTRKLRTAGRDKVQADFGHHVKGDILREFSRACVDVGICKEG